jgi:hypothetical protein
MLVVVGNVAALGSADMAERFDHDSRGLRAA